MDMEFIYAIILGAIQGITEFLPVSSTAHLTLAEHLLLGKGMPLAFDVLLHVGTLLALLIYFRDDLRLIYQGLRGRNHEGSNLGRMIAFAMVPTVVFGFLTRSTKGWAKDHLWVYGLGLLITAWMLYQANLKSSQNSGKPLSSLKKQDALAIGAMQGIGGGFGISRSGSTISIGTLRGLSLNAATRFSFLLGIPTIAAATLFEFKYFIKAWIFNTPLPDSIGFEGGNYPLLSCLTGVIVAFVSGYFSISLLDRLTKNPKLNGFAFYCLCMGTLLLILGTVGVDGLQNLGGIPHR